MYVIKISIELKYLFEKIRQNQYCAMPFDFRATSCTCTSKLHLKENCGLEVEFRK